MRIGWAIFLVFLFSPAAADDLPCRNLSSVQAALRNDAALFGLGPSARDAGLELKTLRAETQSAFANSPHLVEAIHATLAFRSRRGLPIYMFGPVRWRRIQGRVGVMASRYFESAEESSVATSRSWASLDAAIPRVETLEAPMGAASGSSQSVFIYPASVPFLRGLFGRSEGLRFVFRNFVDRAHDAYHGDLHPYLAARRIVAASQLNQGMGIDTVPRALRVRLNGVDGVITEFVSGNLDVEPDPYSRSDAEAFEFLIGNTDGHMGRLNPERSNFVFDSSGRMRVRDHDRAFEPGLPIRSQPMEMGRVGTYLPDRYTRTFVGAIQRPYFESWLRQTVSGNLDRYEIEGILLRREVILKDLELRGEGALFQAVAAPRRVEPPSIDPSRYVPNY
jgi:hypothetical protein